MTPLRAPTVGGLAGGVGATTVARALHGREVGRVGAGVRWPDVVVCRATLSGVPTEPWPGGPVAPVLVVTATTDGPADAVVERLAVVGAGWSGPVVLPGVEHWAVTEDPYAEAGELLGLADPPDTLRRYTEALGRIVELLTADDRLHRPEDDPDGATALRPVRGVRVGPPAPGPGRAPAWHPPGRASQVVGAAPGTAW